jgi:predicted acyl esterase
MQDHVRSEPLIRMRDGVSPTKAAEPPPPPVYEDIRDGGIRLERNVEVPLANGVTMLVDIYRPDGPQGAVPLPVILAWGPYGKHRTSATFRFPNSGIEPGWISKHTAFEAPDPGYWCKYGYAVVLADPPGCWYSKGEMHHGGPQETQDCYDLIEWLGTRPWCNGKVGMSGVSYLACIQWQVAPARPPHLAAINPWEGFSDWYREFALHGGMRDTAFLPRASSFLNFSTTRTEDTDANVRANPLYNDYWESKAMDLSAIDVPAYVVASWSDHGLHTRGTLEGFKQIGSQEKWLQVHGRLKWAEYYRPDNLVGLRAFFDHFLKGTDDSILSYPKVRIEVREGLHKGDQRDEAEWPLARTQYVPLYLDAGTSSLDASQPAKEAQAKYDPLADDGQAVFTHRFDTATELTGHMKLRLWVEAEGADDMDLFVAVEKLDKAGDKVPFAFYALYEHGPVALGWLRASHRELDAARSTPQQPWHTHERELPLPKGEAVPVDIELWPSSTLFEPGETLKLIIKGRDVYRERPSPVLPWLLHEDGRNAGAHVLRTGGRFDAHLLVPVIPARKEKAA